MRKQLKKITFAVIFSMAVSMFAPAAEVAMAAEKKIFTYAEQNSGDTVTTLVMEPSEKVDLKFMGVSNWKSYKYKWTSSNEKVAVVDSNGLITALSKGVATIKLTVGDGSEYTSTPVTVHVGLDQNVTIGTGTQEEIKSYTMKLGDKATLKANGIMDMVGGRYTCNWTSTDTSVARISDGGVITTVAPGLTVIQLSVKKVSSGEVMEATPIALLVTDGSATVVATPTPTKKPGATATPTPTPTAIPTAVPTPTVTPVPSDEYVPYTARLESDKCLLLSFGQKVSFDASDVKLCQLITAGTSVIEVNWDVTNATLNSAGTELRITPAMTFSNGERYIVRVGSGDPGTTVNVSIGAPNRLELSYKCLGQEGVAYAYDETTAIDVPVELSYRLFSGSVDVTETYKDRGYITYELANTSYSENVGLNGEILNFFAPNVSAVLRATFTYYDNSGNTKDINGTLAVRSTKLPAYGIHAVVKYTIIDGSETNTKKIDWNSTETQVIANTENAKVVALIADTYGNYFTTDERGVDEANKIYSIDDYDQLFSKFGYGIEFSAADPNQIIVASDGSIYPFKAANSVIAIVTLTNNGTNGISNYSKSIGACKLKVLAESKLTTVSTETSRVTLAGNALSGYEDRFCQTDVELVLKDQYGNDWKGAYNLELSSTLTEINSALSNGSSSPAVLNGTTLHIDAQNIKAVAPNRTSISLLVTETTTNKRVTINVTIQNPILSGGEILVNNWSLGLQNAEISLGDVELNETTQYAAIEAYKASSNGVKVGLYDDLHIIDTTNYQFTTSNCKAGQVYILVTGPDGKPVKVAENNNALGVCVDEIEDCVKVNVTAPMASGSIVLESLAAGKYTVKATRIVEVGTTVKTAVQTTSFTVKDNTKKVEYKSVKSATTPLTVSSKNDLNGVKAIIESLFVFELDGKEWTEMNANMITDVDFVMNGRTIVIRSVEVAVPVDSSNPYGMTYQKTVTNINKAITTGVN